MGKQFGLAIIGDEILLGKRQDAHFKAFQNLLMARGYSYAWVHFIQDDKASLVTAFEAYLRLDIPIFTCGGIGSTPDDLTRQCVAEVAQVQLVRHPDMIAFLNQKYNHQWPEEMIFPTWPKGSQAIPNVPPYIPAFSFKNLYCLPGFPEMAHPMAEWVLDHYFPDSAPQLQERSMIIQIRENRIIPIMEEMGANYPQLKFFSLPAISFDSIHFGIRGVDEIDQAFMELKQRLDDAGFEYEVC